MDPLVLTNEMLIVFSILGLVIVLLVFNLLRVDVVGLLVMTLLPLTGILSGQEAIAGLGSNAVVVLICVMTIGVSLDKTGVVGKIARKIMKIAGTSESRVVTLLGLTVAVPSGIMSNVGAVALMLPAALKVSRISGIPASKIIMPMGFCANMGGNLTLVGATPLIILNDVMRDWWNANAPSGESFVPLGLFSITPIGIAMVAGALAYFLLIGCRLLPIREENEETGVASAKLRELYGGEVGRGFECVVPDDFSPQTLGQLDLRSKYKATALGVSHDKGGTKVYVPQSTTLIGAGDVVFLVCLEDALQDIVNDTGWQPRDNFETFVAEASPEQFGIVEAIVSSRSALNGHTMKELELRKLYSINPLAVMQGQNTCIEKLVDLVLKPGDTILLHGKWDSLRTLQDNTDLIYTENLRGEEIREGKAALALVALTAFLALALGTNLALSVAGLVALMILVIGKVMHIDEVYKAVEWKTIFLVAGLIPLGVAFEKTGAADYLATMILQQMDGLTTMLLYLILAVMTSFFAMFVSNVGTTVLLVPIAMNLASQVGCDPRIAGMVVAVASINTFMLPTHQVNALIMQPGGYKTTDYMRVGSGMMVLFLVILMSMLYLFY
ncbi:MAG: SLC13 family permease [Thermodesulfobacteriota bacterium]|nr:SLC13 family permease [Thermodesulfobacteriota bacterium]